MYIKRFRFEKARNFRDMGGYIASNGKTVSWGKLYRSDKFNGTTAEEWKVIENAGIKTVIDLRSEKEICMSPDNCPECIRYIHFPIVEEDLSFFNLSSPDMQAFARSVSDGYKNIVLSHGENLAEAINIIIESMKDGGTVYHCTSGKDRTGIVAAIIYYILGVEGEDIVADYQVSHTYNQKTSDKFMSEHSEFMKYMDVVKSEADTMWSLLKLFEKIDIEKYIIENGTKPENIQYLRDIILE